MFSNCIASAANSFALPVRLQKSTLSTWYRISSIPQRAALPAAYTHYIRSWSLPPLPRLSRTLPWGAIPLVVHLIFQAVGISQAPQDSWKSRLSCGLGGIFICIFGRFVSYCTLFQTRVKILPIPWKDLIQRAKTAAGDWVGWTSPAFWSGFLLLLYSLLCSHSTLTAETFPSSVALSVCQSEQSGDRGGVAGAVAVAAAAAAALGGDHSAGILSWECESSRVGSLAVGADRGAEAPPTCAPQFTLSTAAL